MSVPSEKESEMVINAIGDIYQNNSKKQLLMIFAISSFIIFSFILLFFSF